jgi:hypothetical protein
MPRRRKRAKVVEIAGDRSDEVFRILVSEGREMSFLPIPEELEGTTDINDLFAQPTSDDPDRHSDKLLQTVVDSKALQKRLLTIYYDARTSLEETGINILYLALGALKWFEAHNAAEERYAPLLLIPVELSRESAEERFKVKWSGEDITSNLSLLEKMRLEFGLDLPVVPDSDDLTPSHYFRETRDRCSSMPRWEVGRVVPSSSKQKSYLSYRTDVRCRSDLESGECKSAQKDSGRPRGKRLLLTIAEIENDIGMEKN